MLYHPLEAPQRKAAVAGISAERTANPRKQLGSSLSPFSGNLATDPQCRLGRAHQSTTGVEITKTTSGF